MPHQLSPLTSRHDGCHAIDRNSATSSKTSPSSRKSPSSSCLNAYSHSRRSCTCPPLSSSRSTCKPWGRTAPLASPCRCLQRWHKPSRGLRRRQLLLPHREGLASFGASC